MKRINEYKKLFKVENAIDLKELKLTYRSLVKQWHPDKFQADDEKAAEAESMSRQIIDGYDFLVSIAPETMEANKEQYTKTITESLITDWKHKSQVMTLTFLDGTTYEFFGVSRVIFNKFLNADNLNRFAKRNIFNQYIYRRSMKAMQEA